MSEPLRRPAEPLTDGVVTLDAFTRADVLDIVQSIDDEILRWLPLPDPYGETEAREFVDAPANVADVGEALNFAIRSASPASPAGGTLAGSIGAAVNGPRTVHIGYWVAPAFRQKGTAFRAVRLLARHLLETGSVVRVEILVHPDNRPSRRVAERAGAVFEGVREGGLDPPAMDGTTDAVVYVLPGELPGPREV